MGVGAWRRNTLGPDPGLWVGTEGMERGVGGLPEALMSLVGADGGADGAAVIGTGCSLISTSSVISPSSVVIGVTSGGVGGPACERRDIPFKGMGRGQ